MTIDLCPDYPYDLIGMRIVSADGEFSLDQLLLRLGSGRFRADPLGLEWTVTPLGGRPLSGWLEEDEVGDLQELVASARERQRHEGPTLLATDLKAALRQLVDLSVAAHLRAGPT